MFRTNLETAINNRRVQDYFEMNFYTLLSDLLVNDILKVVFLKMILTSYEHYARC